MRKSYRLEVTVIHDDVKGERGLAPNNVSAIGAALSQVIEPLGLEVKSVRRSSDQVIQNDQGEAGHSKEDCHKGSEYEPGEYLAVWPNGDISIVIAQCKRDAIIQLQGWKGSAPETVELFESFIDL